MRKALCFLACAAVLCCAAGVSAETIAVQPTEAGTALTYNTGSWGWGFTVGDTDLSLTELGVFQIKAGTTVTTSAHKVVVWKSNDTGGWTVPGDEDDGTFTLVTSATVPAGTGLTETGYYDTYFAALDTPVTLESEEVYLIVAQINSSTGLRLCNDLNLPAADMSIGFDTNLTSGTDGAFGTPSTTSPELLTPLRNNILATFGGIQLVPKGYLGANMKYVPEPTTLVLLVCGALMMLIRRR